MLRRPDGLARYDMALPLCPAEPTGRPRAFDDRRIRASPPPMHPGSIAPARPAAYAACSGAEWHRSWSGTCPAAPRPLCCRWLDDKAEDSAAIADIEHIESVQVPPRATSTKDPPAPARAVPQDRRPVYSWAHLAGPTGYRLTTNPLRIIGIVLGVGGGTVAYALGASALTLGIGLPYVASQALMMRGKSRDRSRGCAGGGASRWGRRDRRAGPAGAGEALSAAGGFRRLGPRRSRQRVVQQHGDGQGGRRRRGPG